MQRNIPRFFNGGSRDNSKRGGLHASQVFFFLTALFVTFCFVTFRAKEVVTSCAKNLLHFVLYDCYILFRKLLMLNVITFCANSINYNILRHNRHGEAESRPNLLAFRTRFCLTPFLKLCFYY